MTPLTPAASRLKAPRRRVGALALTAAVLAASAVGGGVASAQAASNISTGPLDILMGVGANQSQRILSWYYPSTIVDQSVELEKTSDLADGAFDSDKKTILATKAANGAGDTTLTDSNTKGIAGAANQTGYANVHASLLNLDPNTTYSYHVGAKDGSNWSKTYTFSTKSFTGDFDFLFFGDPQIGSSGNTDLDGQGWADTLKYATKSTPNAELLVSGGDQIEHANNEYEWSAFADSSDVLKQYPWASTIGNHDVGGKAYEQHNKVPNVSQDADYYPGGDTTKNSGGDYYYMYKGVLFIDLNSNAYSGGSDAAHVSYVRSTIESVGDKAKWTVLVYHHSIYSPADHANDTDNQQRRTDFTTAFSNLGVDMVLQGHDHSYSRSYAILNGKKANPAEKPGANEVVEGPGGVIYVTANSSSGSKYYDLTEPDASKGGYGADPLDTSTGHKRHFANSVENQEHVRTYVKVSVTDKALQVANIRASDCLTLNAAVTEKKVDSCGVTLQKIDPTGADKTKTGDAAKVGSVVDQFILDKNVPDTTTSLASSSYSPVAGSTTPVVLTATVAGGLGTLSGTVSFYDGPTLIGTLPLSSGKASVTLPVSLNAGDHSYTATFTSGSVFTGANSGSTVLPVTVTSPATTAPTTAPTATTKPTTTPVVKAKSTTVLKYSKGVATVTVAASGATVTGEAKIFDGSKRVASLKITDGRGIAKLDLEKRGTHKLHAIFAGTGTIASSTSSTLNVTVAKSTTNLTATTAKKTTVRVTVKSAGHTVSGSATVYDGKKVVKTVKVVGGTAVTKVHLKQGAHTLHAVFNGADGVASSRSDNVKVSIRK